MSSINPGRFCGFSFWQTVARKNAPEVINTPDIIPKLLSRTAGGNDTPPPPPTPPATTPKP